MKGLYSIGEVARAYASGKIIIFADGDAAQRIGRCSVRQARRTVLMWYRYGMFPIKIMGGVL